MFDATVSLDGRCSYLALQCQAVGASIDLQITPIISIIDLR